MRVLPFTLLLSAALSAATVPQQVAPASVALCNTGLAKSATEPGCGSPVTVPGRDGNWRLATPYPSFPQSDVVPLPCGLPFGPALVQPPSGGWYNPSDGISQWIMPNGGGTQSAAVGWYIYATSFSLTAAGLPPNPSGVVISGQILSDNLFWAVWLEVIKSGAPAGCYPMTSSPTTSLFPITPGLTDPYEEVAQTLLWNLQPSAGFPNAGIFLSWTSFLLSNTAPIPSGADTAILYFIVNNYGTTPNPTGLRVEFSNPPLPSLAVPAGVTFTYLNAGQSPYAPQ